MLLDLRSFKVTGKDAQASLGRANITCNKNGIPFDTESPFITSGIRLGTPACTTRGFKEEEFKLVADLIHKVIKGLSENKEDNSKIEIEVKKEIIDRKRIKVILRNIIKKSKKKKIDPIISKSIWKSMIGAFINYEYRNFKKK